jgi:hypothetical protein
MLLPEQGFDQASPASRNILEFINEDVPEGAFVSAGFNMLSGSQYHVFKVDTTLQAFLIGLKDWSEDG